MLEHIHRAQYSVHKRFKGPFGDRLIVYADYIASGQPLKFVEEFLLAKVLPTYANTHTESSFTGMQTHHFREEARQFIKRSVNATSDDAVIFCGSGSTSGIDKLARKLKRDVRECKSNIVVFVGPYEHHSNILPWRASEFDIVMVPLNESGGICEGTLEEQLKLHSAENRRMIGSFSAASNVTGVVSNVLGITKLLHKYDALSFWDYAGGAPYMCIDMNPGGDANIDAVFISPHKLVGGPGTPGILITKKSVMDNKVPVIAGGGTVEYVSKSSEMYLDDVEVREEGGTPGIIESIRAGLVFKLKDMVGADVIEQVETEYIRTAMKKLGEHKDVFILGNCQSVRLGFLSFHIRHKTTYLHHNFVVALLNDLFGIQARGGCSCAGPYGHDLLNIEDAVSEQYRDELVGGNIGTKPGWVRLNFNYFIPKSEFEYILTAILWIADNGWKLLKEYHFDDTNAIWMRKGFVTKDSLDSLSDFQDSIAGLTPAVEEIQDRESEWQEYLHFADELAEHCVKQWPSVPNQEYVFPQINHPLRWYTISDEITV